MRNTILFQKCRQRFYLRAFNLMLWASMVFRISADFKRSLEGKRICCATELHEAHNASKRLQTYPSTFFKISLVQTPASAYSYGWVGSPWSKVSLIFIIFKNVINYIFDLLLMCIKNVESSSMGLKIRFEIGVAMECFRSCTMQVSFVISCS